MKELVPPDILAKKTLAEMPGKRGKLVQITVKFPDATKSFEWSYLDVRDGVVIIPVQGNDVYVKREWRPSVDGYIWEFPGGLVEAGTLDQAAVDELGEELGMRAKDLICAKIFYPSNFITMKIGIYIAEGLTPIGQNLAEDEKLEIAKLSIEEAESRLLHDQIPNGQTIIAFACLREYFAQRRVKQPESTTDS